MAVGTPSHSHMAAGAPSHSPMAVGTPSHSHMATGAPSHLPMAAGAPSHSLTVTGAPSHSAVTTGALSNPGAVSVATDTLSNLTTLRMAGAFPFSTAQPVTVPSSVSVSNSTNASSGGQVVINGTGVSLNFTPFQASQGTSNSEDKPKLFVLKLKTKQIRICQSCRKDYDGANDTLGLVVARAERQLVSNLATGCTF